MTSTVSVPIHNLPIVYTKLALMRICNGDLSGHRTDFLIREMLNVLGDGEGYLRYDGLIIQVIPESNVYTS